MPLLCVDRRGWTEACEGSLLPWIADQLGQSPFLLRTKLGTMKSLAAAFPDAASVRLLVLARMDRSRGRLELAVADARHVSPIERPKNDPVARVRRILAGVPAEVDTWVSLHEGWEQCATVADGRFRQPRLFPTPVAYPGTLIELVFDLASLSPHPMLNEPSASPRPTMSAAEAP
jgi:hypothetical protein